MVENNATQIADAVEVIESFYLKLSRLIKVLEAATSFKLAHGEGAKLPASITSEFVKLGAVVDRVPPEVLDAVKLLAKANHPLPRFSID